MTVYVYICVYVCVYVCVRLNCTEKSLIVHLVDGMLPTLVCAQILFYFILFHPHLQCHFTS